MTLERDGCSAIRFSHCGGKKVLGARDRPCFLPSAPASGVSDKPYSNK